MIIEAANQAFTLQEKHQEKISVNFEVIFGRTLAENYLTGI